MIGSIQPCADPEVIAVPKRRSRHRHHGAKAKSDLSDLPAILDRVEALGVETIELPAFDMDLIVGGRIQRSHLALLKQACAGRKVAYSVRAREEALKRTDPAEYDRRKAEAYLAGGGDPAPVVVTFTTETACMAVNELLQA